MATTADNTFKQAMTSFQAGRLDEAESKFREVLRHEPKNVAALNLLSVLLAHSKRYDEAEPFIKMALEINADSDATFYNYGLTLKALKRPQEALERFNQALSINATVAETWNNRGTILSDLKRYDDALADFKKAISLQPNYSEAFYNKGKSLAELKRHEEALAAFDKALSIKPDLEGAWLGRGNVFYDLKRYEEAFAAYDKALSIKPDLEGAWLGRGNVFYDLKRYEEAFAAYDKALTLKPDLEGAWLGRGNVFYDLKRYEEASAAYDKALTLKPDLEGAWLGRGNVFYDLRRYKEALAAFDKALSIKPDLEGAWLGRGNVFYDLRRYKEALAAFDKALSIKPDLEGAWLGRGNVFSDLKRYDEAFAAYERALAIKPDLISAEGSRLHAKMHLCNWSNFDAECKHLIESVRNGNENASPFQFLAIPSSAGDQLGCSKLWVAKETPPTAKRVWQGERYYHDRIRVAYLSADFRQHPVSLLAVGMFEHVNKSRFDVTAISIGSDDNSEIRQRLKASFERFVDVRTYSDDEIANLIKELEVDILVDLMGFTQNARTTIFARRCAPIQVNYLGYPGTMGADFIDYIIADPILVPTSDQNNYMEKVVYLPHSYLPHDNKSRIISDKSFERHEFGLPDNAFIFCCFNNAYKYNPHVFRIWMNLLKVVDHSVLWLSENNATAASNLKKEAISAGVNADRIVFAKRLPSAADHLARHQLADLFLDTLPYNAHTTASDALWAGLPVLTCIGETFAGRVAASLLDAIGLPELITRTLEAYEALAIDFATHPEKLTAIKNKLAENRLTAPLFDTKLFTKHVEAAYKAMYERYQAGSPPGHITVTN